MEKAVIYTRVSTEEQAKEGRFSLAVQKRLCEEYAQKENLKITEIFEDAGKTATNTNRAALKNMLAFIEENKNIKAVLVQDTDRLARNTFDHLGIKAFLKKNNAKLISISQPFINDTPEGRMIDTVVASANTFQSDITSRKVKKGMEQRAMSGWLPGLSPIGYQNITDTKGKKIIIIDKEKAPFIKMAFELYLTGNHGAETINDILYTKGLKSKRGGKLSLSKFYEVLENTFYYGEFNWDGTTYKGSHDPIIDKETFNLVNKIKSTRASRRSCERKHNFLLTGFVFCKCGRRLTAEIHNTKTRKTFAYYHCTRGRKCHDSRNIPIANLEKQVEESFKAVDFTDEFYNKLIKRLKYYYDNHIAENRKELRILNARKAEIVKKLKSVEKLLIENTISKEVYTRNSTSFNKDIEIIQGEIYNINKNNTLDLGKFEELIDFSRNIYKSYKTSEYESKRRYLAFFWEKFIIEDKEVIETVVTEPFKLLQTIQKPLIKGENVNLTRVINPAVWSSLRTLVII